MKVLLATEILKYWYGLPQLDWHLRHLVSQNSSISDWWTPGVLLWNAASYFLHFLQISFIY